ncbi:MAG: GSCFA domain-containing protein [Asticcacaulis sp.]
MNPYKGNPYYQFWKRAGGLNRPSTLDPVTGVSFTIGRGDPVVTAGSCFAQHVARRLSRRGFNFHVSERAHPFVPQNLALNHNYGVFSARYGNIYTARQLRQLIERAYGLRQPKETAWAMPDGTFVDPFRPQIQPGNFISEAELLVDRAQHFAAVRSAFAAMSVFVFTLGLTETWVDRRDGSVLPAGARRRRRALQPENVRIQEPDGR